MSEGSVIIIGGAEDKVRDRVILSRFMTLAVAGRVDRGDLDGVVAGLEAGDRYRQVLSELGVAKVRTIHAITRAQANDETSALAIRDAPASS